MSCVDTASLRICLGSWWNSRVLACERFSLRYAKAYQNVSPRNVISGRFPISAFLNGPQNLTQSNDRVANMPTVPRDG